MFHIFAESNTATTGTLPTSNVVRAPPPSPPVPPPFMPPDISTPVSNFSSSNSNLSSSETDPRSELMKAIRGGTTLKVNELNSFKILMETYKNIYFRIKINVCMFLQPVNVEQPKSTFDNSRGDLLNEIRRGVELRAVSILR